MKVISVTPAGRRQYLEILASYLLRNRNLIHEHHWWLNTRNPEDVAYIHCLADAHPDFFRVIAKPLDASVTLGGNIWNYLRDCTDPDTLYLRLDDDICYMTPNSIENFIRYRQARPEPFLVLGNIVNNAVCTHFCQRAGIVPTTWGVVGNECTDPVGHRTPRFTRRLHKLFLHDIEVGGQNRWKKVPFPIDGTRRFSINAISWYGVDLAGIPELHVDDIDEEPFLTVDLPTRLGRPNELCPGALFAHYAFYTQREYLERTSPDLLARYRAIAQSMRPGESRSSTGSMSLETLLWRVREVKWQARRIRRNPKRFVVDLIKGTRPTKAA